MPEDRLGWSNALRSWVSYSDIYVIFNNKHDILLVEFRLETTKNIYVYIIKLKCAILVANDIVMKSRVR